MTKLYAVWMLVVAITLCAFSASAQSPAKDSVENKGEAKSEQSAKAKPAADPKTGKTPSPSNGSKGKTPAQKSANASGASTRAEPASKAPAGGAADGGKAAQAPAAAASSAAVPRSAPAVGAPTSPATAKDSASKDSASKDSAASYVVRLRDLESRVDELKEQIRRSHTRLTLLSESVLSAGVGGAQAQVVFRNAMSNAFRVEEVMVVLDGAVQYNEKGDEAPHRRQQVTPVFDGAVPPGDHTIQIIVNLRGHGYGVFSYLKGFSFEAKSTHSFTVRQGGAVRIEAIAFERGDATTPLEQKPALRFKERPLVAEEQGAGQ